MLRRLYVHNFRCLENFELSLADASSMLLLGKNGAGKSGVGHVLYLLSRMARGTNRVREHVQPKDFSRGRTDSPMVFELDVQLDGTAYAYRLALEHSAGSRELRVLEESLRVEGQSAYARDHAQIDLGSGRFALDWHLIALPVVQESSAHDPLAIFKRYLSRMLVLSPVPQLIDGESNSSSLEPARTVSNLGEWFAGLLSYSPASYSALDRQLRSFFPDFLDIKNPLIGGETRKLLVQFREGTSSISVPFSDLSDGEKCLFIGALVLAANEAYGPLFCFWDEPDSHISLSEIGQFIAELRRSFPVNGGQVLVTSHNAEVIRRFSDESTLLLGRRNHLEPTQTRRLDELPTTVDRVDALILGDSDLWA